MALRNEGFDVLTIADLKLNGVSDETVFKNVVKHKRVLLTYDRGFGDIFRFDISKSYGIIVVLISQMTREEIIKLTIGFLKMV